MKKLITIAMMTLGLALTGACKDEADAKAKDAMKDATKAMDKAAGAASKAADATAKAADTAKAAVGGASKEAYIQAAIATACASKKFKDADLAKEIQKIQKAAGFDTQSYVKMAQEVAKDSDATMKIAKGAAACN